jgi:O-antigen/teichoic acid export membrane protein
MIRLILLTAVLGIAFFLSGKIGVGTWFHADFPFIVAFFFSVGFLNQLLVQRGMANQREKFVTFYLASTVLRLLLSLIFLVIFYWLGTPDFERFVLNFLAVYVIFLGFEIWGTRRTLRHFSE